MKENRDAVTRLTEKESWLNIQISVRRNAVTWNVSLSLERDRDP